MEAFFRAYFAEGGDIGDRQTLLNVGWGDRTRKWIAFRGDRVAKQRSRKINVPARAVHGLCEGLPP